MTKEKGKNKMKITIHQGEYKLFNEVEIGEVFEQEDEVPCLKISDCNCFNLRSNFIYEIDDYTEVMALDVELIIRK